VRHGGWGLPVNPCVLFACLVESGTHMNGSAIGIRVGMKRLAMVLGAVVLVCGAADVDGQSAGQPSSAAASSQAQADRLSQVPEVQILSDTQGVDFAPYLKQVLQMIRRSWLPLLPEEARPPVSMHAETLIRFSIGPDGKISAMHLDGSTHQVKVDRAAWGAIVGAGQFPPLPAGFSGPSLELRIRFNVNRPATINP
jgi:TonB family protein